MADKDKDWEGVESEFTYKPSGPQKTVNEYAELDKEDESLQKWKASLGIVPGQSLPEVDPNDQRRVIIQSIALETQGRPDVMVNLTTKGALGSLKDKPFVIKEGITYRIKVTFRIQREVVSGLRYLQIVKRKGVKVDKLEEMIGSYGPRADPYEKKLNMEEAPSGLLARGEYVARSKFTDDDDKDHLDFEWKLKIVKQWE